MKGTTAFNRASIAVAILAASACAGKKPDVDHANGATVNPGVATTDSASRDSAYGQQVMQGDMQLSDANILALLSFANKAEVATGQVALKKATSVPVKAYAREMIKDHEVLETSGGEIAKRINANPDLPALNPLATPATNEDQLLQRTPAGPDFDRVYVEGQIRMHQQVIGVVRNAATQARSADLRSMLVAALPELERHLTEAQQLQQQLTQVAMVIRPHPRHGWDFADY